MIGCLIVAAAVILAIAGTLAIVDVDRLPRLLVLWIITLVSVVVVLDLFAGDDEE